jgi:hypothetical protein
MVAVAERLVLRLATSAKEEGDPLLGGDLGPLVIHQLHVSLYLEGSILLYGDPSVRHGCLLSRLSVLTPGLTASGWGSGSLDPGVFYMEDRGP